MNKCVEDHFRWIGIMADRIICAKNQDKSVPLLSLSFLKDNNIFDFFSQFSRPTFPITVENLTNAKLYGVIVSAVAPNKKELLTNSNIQYLYNFDLILDRLLNEGYIPQKPCDPSGLESGNLEQHLNLCKSIEFLVVDRSLNIRLLISDLHHLPRSFFVLTEDTRLLLLEDAISLWLSKFHCISDFSDEVILNNNNTKHNKINNRNCLIQMDTSKFSKVAACLSRVFPDQIDKDEIMNGDDEDESQYNMKLSKSVLDKIHAFVIEKFPTDENLFALFIADLFYATRMGQKSFVIYDQSLLYEPHLPAGDKGVRSPRRNRGGLSNKINLSYYMSGTIDALEGRKENEEMDLYEERDEEKYNIITPYSSLQTIKDREEYNANEGREEERYSIVTPYSSLQTINEREESKMNEAKHEEKYNITPYNTLQNIKDGEEFDADEAKDEEKYNIVTPYSSLQTIKDSEEDSLREAGKEDKMIKPYNTLQNLKDSELSCLNEAKDEEKYNIVTPYSSLQNIKDGEESNMAEGRDEEKNSIVTPYTSLQDIKDDEESNMAEGQEEEKYNIVTPYSSLQTIKDGEESNMAEGRDKEKNSIITPYTTLQDIKDDEEGNLRNAENESKFNELIKVPSSNLQKARTQPKIVRPVIEPKSSSNSISNRTRERSLENGSLDFNSDKIDDSALEEQMENEKRDKSNSEGDIGDIIGQNGMQLLGNSDTNDGKENQNHENENETGKFDDEQGNEDQINQSGSNFSNRSNNNVNSENQINQSGSNFSNRSNNNVNSENQINQSGSNFSNRSNNNVNSEDQINQSGSNFNNKSNENVNSEDQLNQSGSNFSNKSNENVQSQDHNDIDNSQSFDEESNAENQDNIRNEGENSSTANNDFNESISIVNDDEPNSNNDGEIELLNNSESTRSDDEIMTDEMIEREEEKYAFHLKLKQLTTSSQTLTTNTVPNYETIANALRFKSLPGPKYSKLLDRIIETMKEFKDERIVLLMNSKTQKFRGIYILANDGNMAEKLWGKGPNNVQNDDVSILYKYSDDQNSFDVISSKNFTQTTDGFSLITPLEIE